VKIPTELADGFNRFRVNAFQTQRMRFEALAARGQKPHTLIIGCCDSRVDPSAIFDASPGELFIVRNVANLVPPYELDGGYHGVSAALEFAVKHLGISNVLVLGHQQCGGVRACAEGHSPQDSLFLGHWIEALQPALVESQQALGPHAGIDEISDDLELRAIRHSIERLKTFPFVQTLCASGELTIHGARFGVSDGRLEWLNNDGEFEVVSQK